MAAPLRFRFPGGAILWLVQPTVAVESIFRHRLHRFLVAEPGSEDKTDLVITSEPVPGPVPVWRDVPPRHLPFLAWQRGEWPALIFSYRGQQDIAVLFGATTTIYYPRRPRLADRLYGLFLFVLQQRLIQSGALLFHGAAVARGEQTLLFTAGRGGGKTGMLLTLLRQGWDYLGEDKLILWDGHVYPFQTGISVRDHHLQQLPWLPRLHPSLTKVCRGLAWRRTLRAWATTHLPRYLLPGVERFYEKSVRLQPETLFPQCVTRTAEKPQAVVLLTPGQGPAWHPFSTEQGCVYSAAIQTLQHHGYAQAAEVVHRMKATLHWDLEPLLRHHLGHTPFFRLSLPPFTPPEEAVFHCLQCLPPRS